MSNYIKEYHDKPSFEVRGKSQFNIYLGMELEVECLGGSISREVKAGSVAGFLGDFGIVKRDGSLDNGFEICTSPASLDYHGSFWNNFFEFDLKDIHTKHTCGMHVHISKEPLSKLQIGKILVFVNSSPNRKFVNCVAGREPNDYCSLNGERKLGHSLHAGAINRHSGVNISNLNTVEIRIFQSTLNKNNILKNLEFCDALVRFTFPSATSIATSKSYLNFIEFVKINKVSYINLYNFLISKGYIDTKKRNALS